MFLLSPARLVPALRRPSSPWDGRAGVEVAVGRADILAEFPDPLALALEDREVLGAREAPPHRLPAAGIMGPWGLADSLYLHRFRVRAGPEPDWDAPGPSGQRHSGAHPTIPHPWPSPRRVIWRSGGGAFLPSPWRCRPGRVPQRADPPPACLGVAVVLDGQPELPPVQGAAHAQTQLQVLVTQAQQHLLRGKVRTECGREVGVGTRGRQDPLLAAAEPRRGLLA